MEAEEITNPSQQVAITPLDASHDISEFDCGRESLDLYLKKHALSAPAQGTGRTWVAVTDDGKVVAYYTLAFASFERQRGSERAAKGMPAHPIPALLLARLAVDKRYQGSGLGAFLLEAVMRHAVGLGLVPGQAKPDSIPVRCLMVNALDSKAASFYHKFGFEPSPTDPMHLFLLLKDLLRYFN